MTITTALEKFIVQLRADGRSGHTIGQYRRHIRTLARWLGDVGHSRDVRRIDHGTIAEFLVAPAATTRPDGKPKLATSMNVLRASLKGFTKYLQQSGLTRHDAGRLIRRAVCSPVPPRAMSSREQKQLLKSLAKASEVEAQRDHALFHLMLASGIRLGSALALDVEDVDLPAGELTLTTTKSNRPDRVFLGKAIRSHLRRYIGSRKCGPLFAGRTGSRITSRHVRRRLAEWLTRAGIERDLSPHSLRHAFAMRVYERSGGDILVVKQALLHKSIGSTLAYTTANEERVRRAL